jgi:glycosyltransferase involved in cell wall biosynthesis
LLAVNACTIVRRRELARARVLASTFAEHHPGAGFTVLVLDADPLSVDALPHARVVGLSDVAGEAGGILAAANAPGDLAMALLPRLVQTVLADGAETVLYIGAAQRVLGPLHKLAALLAAHQVVLVAHLSGDRSFETFGEASAREVFNPQLVGVRNGRATADLLAKWPRYFVENGSAGGAAASAWLDSVPAVADDVVVLRDPAYGADPWSLTELRLDGDGESLAVDGEPVVTFDFSAMRTDDPLAVFDGQDRVNLPSAPALVELCSRHAQELIAAGLERDDRYSPEAFTRLEGGARLTPTIRRLFVRAVRAGELTVSPFTDQGRRALIDYLNAPSEHGEAAGLTRLHMAIWQARDDVRTAYPHIDGPDGPGYAGWLCQYGAEQEGLNETLLPPTPQVAFRDADPMVHEDPPRWGVNVAGFFTAELGIGEAARLLMAALDARGVPALPIQGNLAPPSRRSTEFSYRRPDEAAYPINIVCINGDGIPVFAREAGRSFFENRYTIALWWWEVGEPPPEWKRAFDFIDEVWVGSQHTHDLLAPISPVPAVKMTMAVLDPPVAELSRSDLGLPGDDEFLFLFVHDYHSVAARKNPAGVVEAFKRAFPVGTGPKLVIKSINGHMVPDEHDRVLLAAEARPDITLIDAYVSAAEKNAMIAHCNCYVSLHRAEGFGLTVAEAMLLGKPVIATRYGGTLEFTNDDNSYLVDGSLIPVGDGAGIYPADAIWMDPDLDHAAKLMRHVFANRAEAAARGWLARRHVAETHSPSIAGETMERRLRRVRELMFDRGVRTLNPRHVPALYDAGEYPDELERSPMVDWTTGRWGRLSVRRPMSDWIRSSQAHQREVDKEIFDRISALDARVRELGHALSEQQHARHAETLAVLRGLERELAGLRRQDLDEAGGLSEDAPESPASNP